MKRIETFFLRAKHWQLFLLLVGMFGLAEAIAGAVMAANVSSKGGVGTVGLVGGAIMALGMACSVGWFWAMGTFLNSINQPALRMKAGFFRFAVIYPVLFICAAGPFLLEPRTSVSAVISALNFFAVFCLLYDLYFVSKSMVMAETGKPATFYNYAGPFFLIWFFPLGIWFVQPRVNRLYAERKNAQPPIQAAAL
jgi:hypothetical protein